MFAAFPHFVGGTPTAPHPRVLSTPSPPLPLPLLLLVYFVETHALQHAHTFVRKRRLDTTDLTIRKQQSAM